LDGFQQLAEIETEAGEAIFYHFGTFPITKKLFTFYEIKDNCACRGLRFFKH
jgi:hypothetical protein